MFILVKLIMLYALFIVTISPVVHGECKDEGSGQSVFFCRWDLFYREALSPNHLYRWHSQQGVEPIWSSENFVRQVRDSGKGRLALLLAKSLDFPTHNFLQIITEQGSPVISLREQYSIQELCWDPSGNRIALALGDDTESSGYMSRGVYVFSLDTGEVEQISKTGWNIHWARFDEKIYYTRIKNGASGVMAYDLTNEVETASEFFGTHFSRDETYYHVDYYGDKPLEIYDRETGLSVAERAESPVPLAALRALSPTTWLDDKNLLAYISHDGRNYALDVSTGLVRRTRDSIVTGYDSGSVLVQKSDGSLVGIEISCMPEVSPEELPKTRKAQPWERGE